MAANRLTQGGMVLLVSLLVLLVMATLSATSLQTAFSQLRMAANEQSSVQAQQMSLAIVDAIYQRSEYMSIRGAPGYRLCGLGQVADCDESSIDLGAQLPLTNLVADYHITRMAPASSGLAFAAEQRVSSSVALEMVRQEIGVRVHAVAGQVGKSQLVQGVVTLRPASAQSGVMRISGEAQ